MSDLVRVAAPDGAVRAVRGMTGREYTSRDGMFEMTAADARALRAEGGFVPTVARPVPRTAGFECSCSFRPFFRRCSRCGGTAERVVC